MQNARLSRTVQLPQSEVQQIVQAVTNATLNPIVCIWQHREGITVFTDFAHYPQRFMVYELRRPPTGPWRIISRDIGSVMVCP